MHGPEMSHDRGPVGFLDILLPWRAIRKIGEAADENRLQAEAAIKAIGRANGRASQMLARAVHSAKVPDPPSS